MVINLGKSEYKSFVNILNLIDWFVNYMDNKAID